MLRILVIHTAYRFKGGEDSVVEAEKNLLQSNGNEVYYLPFENPSNPVKALWLFFISIFNPISYLKVSKVIKTFKPDVVHVHNWHFAASPAIFIAARKQKIPMVYTLHNYRLLCPSGTLFHKNNIFLDSLLLSFPWPTVKKKAYRDSYLQTFWLALVIWLHKITGTWKKVDKYIALTPFARELFTKSHLHIASKQISVKPNFTVCTNHTQQLRTKTFLFIGRLSEEKGINCLLNAFIQNGLDLVIGGNGPLVDMVMEASKQYPNIKYSGELSRKQVQHYMQTCTALVFPSIWYEGMPMTILEAFSMGTPVIASKLGAMESIIESGYNGFHFEPGNVEDIIRTTKKWQDLPDDEKKIIQQNARKTHEELYTPETNLAQLINIYQSVLK